MANHVTVSVTVTPVGPKPATVLEAECIAVPVDGATILVLGVIIAADSTAINGHNQVVRTIRMDFTPAFKALFPDGSDQRKPFYNFMRGAISKALKTPCLASLPVLT